MIEGLSMTYEFFPFQLLPHHLLEVEVEALIKDRPHQALIVVTPSVVIIAPCSTSSSFLRLGKIRESLEATFIVELVIV